MQMAKSQGAICGTAQIVPSLWLYNNLLPLNVRLVLRKTPVSIYILVLYIYKQFKSGLAAPPLGEVTCYSVYILTLSFIFFSKFIIYRTERWRLIIIIRYPTSKETFVILDSQKIFPWLSDADEFKKSTEANHILFTLYVKYWCDRWSYNIYCSLNFLISFIK